MLIATYGLGLLFSLKTHREFFGPAEHAQTGGASWPLGLALATLAAVTVLVALVSEVFVESVQQAAATLGMTPRLRRFHRRGAGGRCGRDGFGVFRRT